jgi:DNA-binding transcriptional LysR family regulator
MDWDKLRIFHSVAECSSLTSAGQTLGLSQSAVSRHIATLEESLGVALFRRHARGLVLTEQGLILHEATKEINSRLSLIKGQLMDTHRSPAGPLTVTVSEFIASTWLAPRLAEFREAYPEIQLTILIDDKVLNLNKREADAAIRLYKPKEIGLIQRHLASIHFHICGSKSYFKKHRKPQNAEDLQQHFLLGFPEGVQGPFDDINWLFETAHIDPDKHQRIILMNSMYAIYRAAREGAGLAVLPDYIIRAHPELEVVLPNLKRPDVDMYFIYAEERRNSKRINALRDFVLQNVEKTTY